MRTVRAVENGYIVKDGTGREQVIFNLEEVFSDMLQHFEGRGEYFGGNMFGVVVILRKPTPEFPEVKPA
jgi:hypothetical protein